MTAGIEQVFDVAMPRPRGFDGRRSPRFHELDEAISGIFLARGVLRGDR